MRACTAYAEAKAPNDLAGLVVKLLRDTELGWKVPAPTGAQPLLDLEKYTTGEHAAIFNRPLPADDADALAPAVTADPAPPAPVLGPPTDADIWATVVERVRWQMPRADADALTTAQLAGIVRTTVTIAVATPAARETLLVRWRTQIERELTTLLGLPMRLDILFRLRT